MPVLDEVDLDLCFPPCGIMPVKAVRKVIFTGWRDSQSSDYSVIRTGLSAKMYQCV